MDHKNNESPLYGQLLTEIEEQKKKIASLQAENEMLHFITANAPGNMYWKDKNAIILGCNINQAQALDLSAPEEIIGKSNSDLQGSVIGKRLDAVDFEVMQQNKEISVEEILRDKKMRPIIYLTKKIPMKDKKNNIIGVIGTSFDITQRKKMEEDIKTAKELAEAASQEKSDFIANMSHDVKTPLSGIISIAELLSYRLKGEEKEFATFLLTSGQQLLNFFNNCIELFKFEKNYAVVLEEEFDLKKLLNSLRELYVPSVTAKQLTFSIEYIDQIPTILLGNHSGLYRILLNLIGNAIKFTEQGHICLQIKFNTASTPTNILLDIAVEDTGIGIPKDKQEAIFDRFTRLTPAYKGTYEGSGIGLYVVQKIVETMRGSIAVHSDAEMGSQFVITLPFQAANSSSLQTRLSHLPHNKPHLQQLLPITNKSLQKINMASKTNIHANGTNVLLVEDNMVIQKTMLALLESVNCNVIQADSGEKALELFDPGKYDIIFMDIGLPGLQGDTVAALLRKMESGSLKRTPIVALTAHSDATPEYYASIGIDNIINKPMTLEKAKDVIAEYCSK